MTPKEIIAAVAVYVLSCMFTYSFGRLDERDRIERERGCCTDAESSESYR